MPGRGAGRRLGAIHAGAGPGPGALFVRRRHGAFPLRDQRIKFSSMAATLSPSPPRKMPSLQRRTELGLVLLAALVTVSAYTLAWFGTNGSLPPTLNVWLAVVIGLGLVAHLFTRWLAPRADPVMLPTVVLLNGLGWVMIARLDPREALMQAVWTAVGVAIYVATLALVRRSRDLERYRYLMALAGVVLLLLPLVPHLGLDINGARLWIRLGPLTFQPVEVAQIALVVFFASSFGEKRELLSNPTMRVGNHLLPDPRIAGPIVAAWALSMLVMTAERNVGFALLIFVLFLAMLWVATGRIAFLAVGMVLFAVGAWVGSILFAQVNERITVWLDPWRYADTIGYQLVQAQYALGTGGVTGTGLGLGHPLYIPVVTSDFIFAAFGEELGLLGTSALVAAFLVLVAIGFRTALRARTDFSKLMAAGLTAVLGFQSFFIMAGIARLLPLTGVTLPFVAYGGSSLVSSYLLVGLLTRISDESADA